jgi:endoglucanase
MGGIVRSKSILRLRWLLPALLGITSLILAAVLGHTPSRAAAAPLSISISGNHFVNGAGQPIRLLGVNHQSFEYACVDGFGYNDGHMDAADAAAVASWNANAVRVPLNEDCWLGLNGQPNSSQTEEKLTQAGYQQAVEEYVADLNAHGLYAILDLHWTAPGAQVANSQQPMPDEHSVPFWQSVAQTFKSNPAVVFDLFNEPFDPTDKNSGDDEEPLDKVSWDCWESGGCDTVAYTETAEGTKRTGAKYQVVGMQTLLSTIRETGATQPVMVGGLNFANDLTEWATHAPNDPLNQEAASFHNYMGKPCDNVSCWNSVIAPIAANVPVVTGEFAEDNFTEQKCANTTPSTFDQDYMTWADQHGVSYLAWAWTVLNQEEKDGEGCSAFYLIEDYGGTPAVPNGTALHDHLLTLSPGGVTTSTTTGGGANQKPPIALRTFKDVVQSGGSKVAFTLTSAASCTGTLTGQTVNSYAVTSSSTKHERHRVALGTVHFSLKAGKPKTVVLTLSRSSYKLLAAKRTLKVQFTIILTSAGHRTAVIHHTVTLKAPAAHMHASP